MLAAARSKLLRSPAGETPSRVTLVVIAGLVALGLPASNACAAQPRVGVRAADRFADLAGQAVTNAAFSTLNGDLGVSPGSALSGFPPGTVNGTIHATDPVASRAKADLTTTYNDAAGRTPSSIALPAEPAPSEPSVEELHDIAQQLTGDFTAPTVRILGKRRIRMPRVAGLLVVARDNKRVTDLEVLVDGRPRYVTPSLDESRRKLVLRLRFRRGRHKIVAHAVDGASTSSRLARATVVVR